MRDPERQLAARLSTGLATFASSVEALPGVASSGSADTFVRQIVESDRRNRYISYLLRAELSESRCDPASDRFDPLKAAVIQMRHGNTDEAFWMIFLFVHFGRHPKGHWRYPAEVYGGDGSGDHWNWQRVANDVGAFREWMDHNAERIRLGPPRSGFGNHRKYESLRLTSQTVSTYVAWVGDSHHHLNRIEEVVATRFPGIDRFEALYRSLSTVSRFGRTARFDYLRMIGRLGLIDIHPERAFISDSTGPRRGAHLLFDPPASEPSTPRSLEDKVTILQTHLQVDFDVLEDALCNWQKSPSEFKPFRG